MVRLLVMIAIGAISNLCAVDLSGKWIGSMETNGSRIRVSLALNQHGEEVDGTIATGDQTMPVSIEKTDLRGDLLTFEVPDRAGRRVKFRLTATDGLSGEATAGDQVSKVTLFWTRSNGPYTVVAGATSAPVLIHKVEPEYTEEARAAKFEGTVVLKVEIAANGKVSTEHINVNRSLGMGLDEKAIEAVKQWRFKPAYKDGKPVASLAMIEVNFRL